MNFFSGLMLLFAFMHVTFGVYFMYWKEMDTVAQYYNMQGMIFLALSLLGEIRARLITLIDIFSQSKDKDHGTKA